MDQEKNTILVIDDEEGTRAALEMILKDSYRILKASSGAEGIGCLQKQPVDLVITDIHIPDLSGIEVLRQVKQFDPSLEVVMVTGFANLSTAKTALRLGALDYINKPFDAGHIREIAREGLEKRRKAKEVLEQLQNLQKQKEEMEGHLIKSERLINAGQLTCGVIHEMNNPLTIIQGYVEILLKKLNKNGNLTPKENQEYQSYLATVEKQVQQCKDIAMGFLGFVRESKVERHLVQLNLMLAELANLFRMQQMTHRIPITIHADPELPEISVHVGLIRQVFMNLMVNAVHAMPQGGTLDLFTKVVEDGVEIKIRDTGTGIAPENLKKIFQTLFTTKEGGKGSGLGLAITKQIVERHYGRISVESELGKGTTFTLFLPKQPKTESIQGAA